MWQALHRLIRRRLLEKSDFLSNQRSVVQHSRIVHFPGGLLYDNTGTAGGPLFLSAPTCASLSLPNLRPQQDLLFQLLSFSSQWIKPAFESTGRNPPTMSLHHHVPDKPGPSCFDLYCIYQSGTLLRVILEIIVAKSQQSTGATSPSPSPNLSFFVRGQQVVATGYSAEAGTVNTPCSLFRLQTNMSAVRHLLNRFAPESRDTSLRPLASRVGA